MSPFVLVHGAWGGGWQWREVARLLRAAGHHVTTPTLTGLGERAHVAVGVTLETHIADLAEHLWFEDLTDVVLVGWSYGAVPAEGVVNRMPERVRLFVSLDGMAAHEGQIVDDLSDVPLEEARHWRETGWVPAPSEADLADVLADPALRAFVAERERPQPLATFTDRFPVERGPRRKVPHVYLACVEPPAGEALTELEQEERAAVRADPRWDYRELPLNHLGLLYDPEMVAATLLGLV
jgi:pimeloyl-ACP methyl ester carboxylesterase